MLLLWVQKKAPNLWHTKDCLTPTLCETTPLIAGIFRGHRLVFSGYFRGISGGPEFRARAGAFLKVPSETNLLLMKNDSEILSF